MNDTATTEIYTLSLHDALPIYRGADSLDVVELVMAFEEKFKVEIPDSDAEKLITINDVVSYIETLNK